MSNKPTVARASAFSYFFSGFILKYLPVLSFCLFGSIVTLSIAVTVYKNSLKDQVDLSLVEVNFAAEQVHQLVNYVDLAIGAISNQILAGTDFSEISLPRTTSHFDSVLPRSLVVLNAKGEAILDFHPDQPWLGETFSSSDFFKISSSEFGQALILGAPNTEKIDGTVHYPLASAVFDDEGALRAVIVMMVDRRAFQKAIEQSIDIEAVEVALVDQGRGIIAHLVTRNGTQQSHKQGYLSAFFFQKKADLIVAKTMPNHSQFNLLARKPLSELQANAFGSAILPSVLSALLAISTAIIAQVIVGKNRRLESADALVNDTSMSIPGILLRYEVRPDGELKCLFASGASEELLEITSEEILSDVSRFWSMTHQEDALDLEFSFSSAIASQTSWGERWRIVTPSGQLKWLQGRGVPKLLSGGTVLWNTVILEVTELVAVQEELLNSQKAVAFATRLEAVGRLTAGVAHEFNNLMAIVMGNVELALESASINDQEARSMLNDALSALRRGSRQTSELLQFGMKARLCPELTTLNVATKNVAAILANALPENISIEFQLEQSPWFTELDVGQLESAIVNAVLNARDALPKGGKIEIKTENRVLLEGDSNDVPEGEYVVLTVSDNGTGMPREVLHKAIEPYFTTKPVGQGTGLGLSAIHGFVNQTKGCLQVKSTNGQGTDLLLWFKRSNSVRSDTECKTVQDLSVGQTQQKMTVLLVEDNPEVSVTLQRQLAAMGHDVKVCYNGKAAWQALTSNDSIDLVVTDIVMPGDIQGDDLAAMAANRNISTPFIALTGYSNFTSKPDLNFPVLVKPVSMAELEAAIRKCFAE